METMRGGQPWRRYKEDLNLKAKEEESKSALKEALAKEDRENKETDMKREVEMLRSRCRVGKKSSGDSGRSCSSNKVFLQ